MAPALPEGQQVPASGPLSGWDAQHRRDRGFSVYVHIPFCTVRCGYCDFNTYTAAELGGGASRVAYADTAISEIELAAHQLNNAQVPPRQVQTVFFGGGTPTVLPAEDLSRILARIGQVWQLEPGAEVTTEANPDSVDERYLNALAEAGFTRVSFGMQSAVPHVLKTLERTHDPERITAVVHWARQAGLEVSLDLIYGTPGESLTDWQCSVDAALASDPDHVSAYALVVEPGTKLAAQVKRGLLPLPSGDDQADKYELADEAFSQAGYRWYEISNWARERNGNLAACRHNMAYWQGDDWWGIGPGAHSYLSGGLRRDQQDNAPAFGVRWWNVKHPRTYSAALESGKTPAAGREFLTEQQHELERIMLLIRLAQGMPLDVLSTPHPQSIADFISRGLVDGRAALNGVLKLTRKGRLLADAMVTQLVDF